MKHSRYTGGMETVTLPRCLRAETALMMRAEPLPQWVGEVRTHVWNRTGIVVRAGMFLDVQFAPGEPYPPNPCVDARIFNHAEFRTVRLVALRDAEPDAKVECRVDHLRPVEDGTIIRRNRPQLGIRSG